MKPAETLFAILNCLFLCTVQKQCRDLFERLFFFFYLHLSFLWSSPRVLWRTSTARTQSSTAPILRLSRTSRKAPGPIDRRPYAPWSCAPSSELVSVFKKNKQNNATDYQWVNRHRLLARPLQGQVLEIRRRPTPLSSSGSRTSSRAATWGSSGSASSSATSRAVSWLLPGNEPRGPDELHVSGFQTYGRWWPEGFRFALPVAHWLFATFTFFHVKLCKMWTRYWLVVLCWCNSNDVFTK